MSLFGLSNADARAIARLIEVARVASTSQNNGSSPTPPITTPSHGHASQSSSSLQRFFGFLQRSKPPALPRCNLDSDTPPQGFRCSLTQDVIYDEPLYATCQHVFSRATLQQRYQAALAKSDLLLCPVKDCNTIIILDECKSHPELRKLIQRWVAKKPDTRGSDVGPQLPSPETLKEPEEPSEFHCSICMDTLTNPVYLKCKHAFDRHCLKKWLETSSLCPLCRREFKEEHIKAWPKIKTLIDQWKALHKKAHRLEREAEAKNVKKATDKSARPSNRSSPPHPVRRADPRRATPHIQRFVPEDEATIYRSTIRTVQWLLDFAERINVHDKNQVVNLGVLFKDHPNYHPYLEPCAAKVYQYTYLLFRKSSGKSPSHPRFGEFAFGKRANLDVPQAIRKNAVYLSTLLPLTYLFQHQGTYSEVILMNLFDRLPEEMRKNIYGNTYLFLQASGDVRDVPSAGRLCFRRDNGFDAPDGVRAAAIETHLLTHT